MQCLRAYKPRENDELALEKADVVMVTQQSSDGKIGIHRGQAGYGRWDGVGGRPHFLGLL